MIKYLERFYRAQQGFSLIVVIFLMMILAILGWTMANFLFSDLQVGVRSLSSEAALYLAEAGQEWGVRQLMTNSSWKTSTDLDCNHTAEWLTHNLTGGQYSVCCRGTRAGENASYAIESIGYVPNATNYLAMRKLKVLLSIGSMSAGVQAKNLFDWSQAITQGNRFLINTDIVAGHYEGTDGNAVYDQPADLAVPDTGYNRTFIVEGMFPLIDMNYFYTRADYVWNLSRESNITRINGNTITVQDPIFTSGETWISEVGVRNLAAVNATNWDNASWREINGRVNSTTVSLANPTPLTGWIVGSTIRTFRRYYQSPQWNDGGIQYIQGDVLIDVRANDFDTRYMGYSMIATGDIAIRGSGAVQMTGTWGGTREEPSLATQNGNIISPDVPDGNNDQDRRGNRAFRGMIYSENGDVKLNYLSNDYNGTFGNNVILSGSVQLNRQGSRWGWWRNWWRRWRRAPSGGFDFTPVIITWQEQ